MKVELSRMWRSALAMLLAVCMVAGMCPAVAFATESAEKEVINYVSIGDSMSNGYGLDGYTAEAGVYDYGYSSYANQFAAMLAGYSTEEFNAMVENAEQGFGLQFEGDDVIVNHAQLALSAARPEDINFLLNLDYESEEVSALIDKYPDDDGVYYRCSNHSGVAYEDIVYCHGCKYDHIDLPGYNGVHVDDYPAWWTLVHGEKWQEVIGYGDYWTWKELAEDYRFGTVATYIKSIYGTDAEKARAEELMANRPAKPRDDGSNGYETCYVAKHYQEQVANADIVSLGIGNGNFGVWLMGRITTALMDHDGIGRNYVYQVEDALNQLDENDPLRGVIEDVLEEVDPYIDDYVAVMMGDGLEEEAAASIKNVCVYAVVSFMINYKGMVETILSLNPDVEIVLLGMMNTYAGDDAMASEGQVTIGNILDVLFPPLSAYVAALPSLLDGELTAEATFYYAEEYEIECLIQNFGDEAFMNWEGVSRDRFVTGVVGECDCGGGHNTGVAEECTDWDAGIFWELLHGFDMGGITIQYVNAAQIKDYEALSAEDKVVFAVSNKDLAGSIAVYLAIEDAICKSGRMAPVTLVTLTRLELGNPAILSKALSNFAAEQEKVIADYYDDAKAGLNKLGIAEPTQTEINDMSMILSLPVALSNALWTDTELCSMLAVVARNKLGNGLGAHPSVAGHAALAEEMINAYNDGWTADKQTIKNLVDLFAEYHDELYVYAYTYAQEHGYIDDTAAAIEDLIAVLKDIENNCDAAVKAEIQTALDKAIDGLETVKELLQDANTHANEALDVLADALVESVDAVADLIRVLKQESEQIAAELVQNALNQLEVAIEAAADALCELFNNATTGNVHVDGDFKYVAIGDGSAVAYADLLAQTLNSGAANIKYENNAQMGNTIANERENLSDVADADLITVGFANVEFLETALDYAITGDGIEWADVVGTENVRYVEEALAEVEAKVAELNLNAEIAQTLNDMIEAYAYCVVEYAVELPQLIDAISAANPEALIVVVGMYNSLENVTVEMDGASMEIGNYVEYLVDAAAVHGIGYSVLSGNSIYVEVSGVETVNNDTQMDIQDLLFLMMNDFADLYPSEDGAETIKEIVEEALNITYISNPFEDVAETSYYYNAVLWAVDSGVTAGTGTTAFSPARICTRAQVVTFLWKAAGSPEPETTVNPFTDVMTTSYYYKAVLWAYENGITTGKSATTFAPGDECTRAQVMTFLWHAAGDPEHGVSENPFEDVGETSYYRNAALWAVELGITAGKTETTFASGASCNRAQIVTFLWQTVVNNEIALNP